MYCIITGISYLPAFALCFRANDSKILLLSNPNIYSVYNSAGSWHPDYIEVDDLTASSMEDLSSTRKWPKPYFSGLNLKLSVDIVLT